MTKLEKNYNKILGKLITPRHRPIPDSKDEVFFISGIEKAGGWYFYHMQELGTGKEYTEPAKIVYNTLHLLDSKYSGGTMTGYTSWMFYKKS